jgi:hypothetical protein
VICQLLRIVFVSHSHAEGAALKITQHTVAMLSALSLRVARFVLVLMKFGTETPKGMQFSHKRATLIFKLKSTEQVRIWQTYSHFHLPSSEQTIRRK